MGKKPWTKRATIFRVKNKLNSRKIVAFKHSKDVSVTFHYDSPNKTLPEGTHPTISSYNVTGVKKFAADMNAKNISKTKIHISFYLDSSGLVSIAKAEATADYFVEAPKPKPKPKPVVNATLNANATAANATKTNATKADDNEDNKGTKDEPDNKGTKDEPATNTTTSENATNVEDSKPKMIKKTHRRTLTVTRTDIGVQLSPMSSDEKKESMDMLAELDRLDRVRQEREAARNELESFLYSSKDKLNTAEDDVAKVTTEKQRTDVFASFETTEEWLYDEGENLPAEKYHERLTEIKDVVDGIFFRAREAKARPKQLKIARAFLNKTLNATLPKWAKSKPQITLTEHTQVRNESNAVIEWLDAKEAAQAKLEITEKPAFRAYTVKTKLQPLRAMITRLARRPPFSVRPKRPVVNATSAANATNVTAGTATVEDTTGEGDEKKESADKDSSDERKGGDDEDVKEEL